MAKNEFFIKKDSLKKLYINKLFQQIIAKVNFCKT